MLVHTLLKSAAITLEESGVEQGRLEAELLLRSCLDLTRSELFLLHDSSVDRDCEKRFQSMLTRRCQREPLQYIIENCEFWSMDFVVSPAVLIPRPETEFLLEHTLSVLSDELIAPPRALLDLCTGSGVIAAVLASEYPEAGITAVDISMESLAVARHNTHRHGFSDTICLMCADLLTGFSSGCCFDVIVSNPPYIVGADIATLEPEVKDYEPLLALDGGAEGVDYIERICAQASVHLVSGGWLFMEIGSDIAQLVLNIFLHAGCYDRVHVVADFAGRPRVLQARLI